MRECLSWLIDLVVVLRIRRWGNEESLDALEIDHTADSIQARITKEFGDDEDGRGMNSFDFAKGLVKLIDDYTPL